MSGHPSINNPPIINDSRSIQVRTSVREGTLEIAARDAAIKWNELARGSEEDRPIDMEKAEYAGSDQCQGRRRILMG
jgi:hypothetical protein